MRTIIYIGTSDIRSISTADWTRLGISQGDTVWTKQNNFQQTVTDEAALWLLSNQGEFMDEAGLSFGDLILTSVGIGSKELEGRFAAMGDSLAAGVVESGKGTAAPFAANSLNYNSWPFQLVSMFPAFYRMIANAGVGGDVWGGSGKLTTTANPGAASFTFTVDFGAVPFGSQAIWLGGFFGGNPDGKTFSSIIDNGDGTYTATGVSGIVNNHGIGDDVGWGMIGRVKANIFDLTTVPGTIIAMGGTNNLNTTADVAIANKCAKDFGTICRINGWDVVFMELLPRSTYMANVARVNNYMRDMCARYGYDLIKTYDAFSGANGQYLIGGDTTDGLHLTVQGIKKLTTLIHNYMVDKGIRRRPVILAQNTIDPDNLITGNPFFTNATSGFGTLLGSTTATGGSASTIVFGTGTWTVNQWAGYQVRTTGGTGSGQSRQILSNTATTITVASNWGTNPGAGTTFVIEGFYPSDFTITGFFNNNIATAVEADTGAEGLGDSNWLTFSVGGTAPAGNIAVDYPLSPAPSIGDRLLISCRVKSIGLTGGAQVNCLFIDNVFNMNLLKTFIGPDDDMTCQISSTVGGISAAVFRMQFVASTTSALGKVKFNRPRVLNLTTGQFLY